MHHAIAVGKEMLKKMKKEQELNRKVCGKSYCTDYLDYIYVDPMGKRIRPDFLSQHFPDFLVAHQMFNISRPQDFEGHSLSVSDVIAIKRNGEVSVHYVDSIGFKELPGFLDTKPERPSVLMNLKEKCDAPECNPTVCRKARDEHEL